MSDNSYNELKARLDIDRSNISDEVQQTPRLLHRVLYLTARARAELETAERAKSRAFHALSTSYRYRAKENGQSTTKDSIDTHVRSSSEYEKPCDEVLDAQQNLYLWEALAEAWRARNFTLRDLVKLDLAERDPTYTKVTQQSRRSLVDQQDEPVRRREKLT